MFIAIKRHGAATGYVRADQIEVISETHGDPIHTLVRTISGCNLHTEETLKQVFAKMADALNIEADDSV